MRPLASQQAHRAHHAGTQRAAVLSRTRVQPLRPVHAATQHASTSSPSTGPNTAQHLTGRGKVERFLANFPNGQSIMMDLTDAQKQELGAFVNQMVTENPTPAPGAAAVQGGLGTGTWKVFWAPHISAMSGTMLTRFEPILYRFNPDGSLSSHVKYTQPVLGTGWLSASGSMSKKYDDVVEISFDKFWMDIGESSLRQQLDDEDTVTQMMGMPIKWDAIIGGTGRAFFFPSLSVFPVLYLDSEFAVFEFPPLRSKIAITKVPDS